MIRFLLLAVLMVITGCDSGGGSSSPEGQTPSAQNQSPQAVFSYSYDRNITSAPAMVLLDGGASTDPDGHLVSYQWRVDGRASGEGRSLWVELGAAGNRVVELIVTDDTGATHGMRREIPVNEAALLTVSGTVFPGASEENRLRGAESGTLSDVMAGEIVIRYKTGGTNRRTQARDPDGMERLAGSGSLGLFRMRENRRIMADPDPLERARATVEKAREIAALPDVLWAEPNRRRMPMAVTVNDTRRDALWGLDQIGAETAWEKGFGNGVVIAVVDTGIVMDHPDLKDRIADGYDFVADLEEAADGDGLDGDPSDPGLGAAQGIPFHGSHVAGTAAATVQNGIGVAGVAGEATLMPLRALGVGEGNTYDVAQAILYAAGLPNDSGRIPSKAADVINLSLGGETEAKSERDAVAAAIEKGILVVAAAGNSHENIVNYPAGYPDVIAVGAVNQTRGLASYSNFGSWVDLVAPGGDHGGNGILSTVGIRNGDGTVASGYRYSIGTSMATPHVAGVMALMKAQVPGLTPKVFAMLLEKGALTEDLGTSGKDPVFGWGLVDAGRAVFAAADLGATMVGAVPQALDFGVGGVRQDLYLANGGASVGFEILSVTPDPAASWLLVTPDRVQADGTGRYAVSVQREAAAFPATGTRNTFLTVETNGGSRIVPVTVSAAPSPSLAADGWDVRVQLVDRESGKTVSEVAGEVSGGRFDWMLADVPAGRYHLVAQTDKDKDTVFDEAGDADGGYPRGEGGAVLLQTGQADLNRLDFVITYPAP